ncbi:hypothetical protein K438DRAFT_1988650 [Mycena galopus ATCC 62051]|nr:hypothetical protein K438DRAFT_1988650 [Mycena galopus ATCC 62051]
MSEGDDSKGNNHHPQYYFDDDSAVFQLYFRHCPGILYKLHSSVLGFRSAFFKTLFSLPRGPDASPEVRAEGTSDANPIRLPSDLDQHDFDHLLCYIYQGPTMHPKTDDFLVSVLKLSTFFQIEDGIAHAIQAFELQGHRFDAALQFELARRYRVDQWIDPAFHKLMKLPLKDLDLPLMDRIGPAGYVWLVKAKAEIEQHRRQFAFNAPPIVNDPGCENQAICAVTWKVEWGRTIPKVIHHPDVHTTLPELLFSLEETEITDVCDACRKRTVAWIWGTGYATAEDDIVTRAVTALTALQTDEPIRAALRKNFLHEPPATTT